MSKQHQREATFEPGYFARQMRWLRGKDSGVMSGSGEISFYEVEYEWHSTSAIRRHADVLVM